MNIFRRRSLYAAPLPALSDKQLRDLLISFYHTIDLPNGMTAPGHWDLRGNVDAYLGNVDFGGKRVLEIGPASGYLTMEMERRGADIVALDIPLDGNWDFVPFPDDVMAGVREHRFSDMGYIRKTFWATHRAFGLKAKAVYADAYDIPRELGRFDVAVMAAVLLHTSNPQKIIAECAALAKTIIVTEVLYPDLEPCGAIMRLHPTRENKAWDIWWHLTPAFVSEYLSVLGFSDQTVTRHQQRQAKHEAEVDFFTVVASRQGLRRDETRRN